MIAECVARNSCESRNIAMERCCGEWPYNLLAHCAKRQKPCAGPQLPESHLASCRAFRRHGRTGSRQGRRARGDGSESGMQPDQKPVWQDAQDERTLVLRGKVAETRTQRPPPEYVRLPVRSLLNSC